MHIGIYGGVHNNDIQKEINNMKNILKKRNIIILIIIISIFISWVIYTNINIQTTYITVEDNNIPKEFDGFKIAQISDLHNYKWDDIPKIIEKENPDIIVITGDLVDSTTPDFDIAVNTVKDIIKYAPVYYVNGNHESHLRDYWILEKNLRDIGVNILDDDNIYFEKNKTKINIVGIQDLRFIKKDNKEDILKDKLESLLDENRYNILLSHRPELFSLYAEVNANLVFTGHAHGGQIQIPFIGGLIAPDQGLFPEYTKGLYNKNNTYMVVSRGLGNSVIPIRINNMPELVITTLKSINQPM